MGKWEIINTTDFTNFFLAEVRQKILDPETQTYIESPVRLRYSRRSGLFTMDTHMILQSLKFLNIVRVSFLIFLFLLGTHILTTHPPSDQ